jgi:hypothetical protein
MFDNAAFGRLNCIGNRLSQIIDSKDAGAHCSRSLKTLNFCLAPGSTFEAVVDFVRNAHSEIIGETRNAIQPKTPDARPKFALFAMISRASASLLNARMRLPHVNY